MKAKKPINILALLIGLVLILLLSLTGYTQVRKDSAGNYVAAGRIKEAAKPIGKTYTDNKGNVYPIYLSASGRLYVERISKSGNKYKYYLKLQ